MYIQPGNPQLKCSGILSHDRASTSLTEAPHHRNVLVAIHHQLACSLTRPAINFTLDLIQSLRHQAHFIEYEPGVLVLSWVLSAGNLFSICMTESTFEDEWERVLWKKKPYPDNYVPKTFLSSLSKNR